LESKNTLNFHCEDCDKDLKTAEEHDECFNKDHMIRCSGMFVVPGDAITLDDIDEINSDSD
jgi:hypothetical protein